MKITNINRRMPFSETLTRVGSTDSKAFGRTSRTYRKGGLMFTITASQSEWSEFDTNGHLHRMEMITDHLSDDDAALLYRSEATTSRGVAAVNSFLAKLEEEQEAAAAKARKAKAEKAAAEQTAAMEAAETARQQKIAELVIATLKQCGFDPTAQQQAAAATAAASSAAPATPQAAPATTAADTNAPATTPQAPAATTTAPTADQQQQFAAMAEFLKQNYGLSPISISAQNSAAPATTPQQAAPAPANTQATPQAPADDKSKGNGKKK